MDDCHSKVKALGHRLKSRTFGVTALMMALALVGYGVVSQLRIVTIVEEGVPMVYYTTEQNPAKILLDNDISITEYDDVRFTGFEGMRGEISINRAFSVTVEADGRKVTTMMTGGTVREVLEQAGVSLGEDDEISLPLWQVVEENDAIAITRHEHATLEVEEEIPFETRQVLTPLLAPGESQVVEEGETGVRVETYKQKRVDGQLVEHRLLSDVLTREPVDETWHTGFPSRPVSPYNFEWEFNEDGEPVGYKQVFHGAKAAGYSAPAGAGTASGRPAVVGNVAVNPRVIPYGSKLYIASADGSFVYGYAVAADTGTSLVNGVIDVDLFYNTYEESARNGIKYLNIYLLE